MPASRYTTLYTAAPIVEINVRVGTDEERAKLAAENPGRMMVPSDTIIAELLAFIIAEQITPWRSIVSGGGRYTALFRERDDARVVAWLEKHGGIRSPVVL